MGTKSVFGTSVPLLWRWSEKIPVQEKKHKRGGVILFGGGVWHVNGMQSIGVEKTTRHVGPN